MSGQLGLTSNQLDQPTPHHSQGMAASLKPLLLCCALVACLKEAPLAAGSSGSSGDRKRKKTEHAFLHEQGKQRWKEVSKRLFLQNKLSGPDAQEMMDAAEAAGCDANSGHHRTANTHTQNAHRALLRHFAKGSAWPMLYWAQIRVLDRKTNKSKKERPWHPFLLPHEWLSQYCHDPLAWQDLEPPPNSRYANKAAEVAQEMGLPVTGLVPLALHGDGVPVQGTLNEQTLDTFCVNMPTSKKNSDLRVPFTVIQKHWQVGDETFQDIMEIFCWSMRHLAVGKYPESRHDGAVWQPSDKQRRKLAKQAMPARAILTEIRGDWDFYETVFKFPAYNRVSGMCWLCNATNRNYKTENFEPTALSARDFLARNASIGKQPNEIFSLPGVTPDICRPDWMHTVDLGIAADICGHAMAELLREYPGNNQDSRCQKMWEDLKNWYDTSAACDKSLRQLKNMKVSMFKPPNKAPKLHGTAQQIRSVVPWLFEACHKFWATGNAHQKTVCHLLTHLRDCYDCIGFAWEGRPDLAQRLHSSAKKLWLLYIALEQEAIAKDPEDSHTWRVKPKLHLFQHLCTYKDHNPRDFWCYADEAQQGSLASMFERRGGHDSPGQNAKNMLLKWTALTPFLRIPR